MSNINKPSARQQARGALERVEGLEQKAQQIEEAIQQIALAFNQRLQVLQNQLSHSTEIVDAVVSTLGDEVIANAVQANRIQKAIEQADATRAKVAAAIEQGTLVGAEVVADVKADENGNVIDGGSFVEGTEFNAEGEELPPGYVFLRMSEIWPDTRALLAGKAVGAEIPTFKFEKGAILRDEAGAPVASGGKFVVKAIFNVADPSEVAVPKEAPEAPAAEPTEAAQPDSAPSAE